MDVQSVVCDQQSVFDIPSGLNEIFPNFNHLMIIRSGLTFISRRGLVNLQNLNFSSNTIRSIPPDSFWDCPNLLKINLDNNQIDKLDSNTFVYSKNLTHISVQNNLIKFIGRDLFRSNLKLQEIILNDNQIESFEVEFFKLKHIKHIEMSTGCVDAVYKTKSSDSISMLKLQQKIVENCVPSFVCESESDLAQRISQRLSVESRICPEEN